MFLMGRFSLMFVKCFGYSSGQMFVYIGTRLSGNRNKCGANMSIKITAITEPNIKPNHRTKPPTINAVTMTFQSNLNGKRSIFLMFM